MAKAVRSYRFLVLFLFIIAALNLTAAASANEGSGTAAQASPVRPSSAVVGDFVALCESLVVGAADAMPADKYPFAPSCRRPAADVGPHPRRDERPYPGALTPLRNPPRWPVIVTSATARSSSGQR